MIDQQNGKVAFAVLSFGGLFGMGDRMYAVPWGALKLDKATHQLSINADRRLLESAPGFDKDHWPDFTDISWCRKVYDHYGVQPYWRMEAEKAGHGGRGL